MVKLKNNLKASITIVIIVMAITKKIIIKIVILKIKNCSNFKKIDFGDHQFFHTISLKKGQYLPTTATALPNQIILSLFKVEIAICWKKVQ